MKTAIVMPGLHASLRAKIATHGGTNGADDEHGPVGEVPAIEDDGPRVEHELDRHRDLPGRNLAIRSDDDAHVREEVPPLVRIEEFQLEVAGLDGVAVTQPANQRSVKPGDEWRSKWIVAPVEEPRDRGPLEDRRSGS